MKKIRFVLALSLALVMLCSSLTVASAVTKSVSSSAKCIIVAISPAGGNCPSQVTVDFTLGYTYTDVGSARNITLSYAYAAVPYGTGSAGTYWTASPSIQKMEFYVNGALSSSYQSFSLYPIIFPDSSTADSGQVTAKLSYLNTNTIVQKLYGAVFIANSWTPSFTFSGSN